MTKPILTVSEAAQMMGVTRQSIHLSLRKKSLLGSKVDNKWTIKLVDLQNYVKNRYNRSLTMNEDGSLVYNPELGLYSPVNLAQIFGVTVQRIYYLLSVNKLKFYRRKSAYVIQVDDLVKTMKLVRSEDI